GVHNKIRFLKNVAGLWILQQLKAGWAKTGEDLSYADLVALAEQAGPAQQHIDPDDPRFVAPKDMAAAILDYCRSTDQPVPSGKGQFVRCVLESLALKYKEVIANLNSL
ncbi:MAG: FGGY-family carbohydrate kinase, partial [candidate division KSB1 bacterium]|nr:FGGY-family carbohydrate kinase [candidate division KSB1 bacterium]